MKFTLNGKSPANHQICFYYNKAKSKNLNFCSCAPEKGKADLLAQFKAKEINASEGEVVFYRDPKGHNLFVGLGEAKLDAEKLRNIGAKIFKKLTEEKVHEAWINLDTLPHKNKVEALGALTKPSL